MGRRLNRLALDAGLRVTDLSAVVSPVAPLAHAAAQLHLLEHLDAAVAVGDVTASAAAAWRRGLEKADRSGWLFVAPVKFRLIAAKE